MHSEFFLIILNITHRHRLNFSRERQTDEKSVQIMPNSDQFFYVSLYMCDISDLKCPVLYTVVRENPNRFSHSENSNRFASSFSSPPTGLWTHSSRPRRARPADRQYPHKLTSRRTRTTHSQIPARFRRNSLILP